MALCSVALTGPVHLAGLVDLAVVTAGAALLAAGAALFAASAALLAAGAALLAAGAALLAAGAAMLSLKKSLIRNCSLCPPAIDIQASPSLGPCNHSGEVLQPR